MTAILHLSRRLIERPQVVDSMQFTVRSFQSSDVQLWLDLRDRAFAREKLGVRKWTADDFEAEFRQRWWWDPAKIWLADFNLADSPPRLAGSVTLAMRGQPADAKPVVHWLMVAPDARRRGLGRVLMSHLELAAYAAGYREIYLETHSAWHSAARFYEALGYQPSA